jgi:hypothetical protein
LRRAASAAAVVVLALGGCGGDDGESAPDDEQVSSAVVDYAHAFAGGDGARACELLTPEAREAFVKRVSAVVGTTDCGEAMTKLQSFAGPNVTGPFEDATTENVRVDGDRATADLVAGGHTEQVTLEQVDGDWLLTKAPGT